jgi:hypothetical protein
MFDLECLNYENIKYIRGLRYEGISWCKFSYYCDRYDSYVTNFSLRTEYNLYVI